MPTSIPSSYNSYNPVDAIRISADINNIKFMYGVDVSSISFSRTNDVIFHVAQREYDSAEWEEIIVTGTSVPIFVRRRD
jgi:hypothetical protein